jgi:hypothetical protein
MEPAVTDVRFCDEAGLLALMARERQWRALWEQTQAELTATRQKLRELEADHERLLVGRDGGAACMTRC